jgi:hypothetical protein
MRRATTQRERGRCRGNPGTRIPPDGGPDEETTMSFEALFQAETLHAQQEAERRRAGPSQ